MVSGSNSRLVLCCKSSKQHTQIDKVTYRDGPLCTNSFYWCLYDYNSTDTYVKGQLVLTTPYGMMPSTAVTVCQPPSFLEGTACRSPSIGASQMARLSDGGNTPAGLTSACLATATARRHPMVAMNPLPSTCLIGSDSTNELHDSSCLQPERTLITGDPVSDTAGSNCPALLCPGNGHSMTSSRMVFWAIASP